MKTLFASLLLLPALFLSAQVKKNGANGKMTPDLAYQRLMEGNKRFTSDQSEHPDRTGERREETAAQQFPFAAIMGCADSRVSPEIIFDQGIGDLFIVRVAGNVVGPVELASLEYSALYLNSSIILVLGHENCGAVKAVLAGQTKDIEPVANLIQPSVKMTKADATNRVEATIKANVKNMVDQLNKNPALKKLVDQNKLKIVGGYYHLNSGEVEFLNN
jgi:carbonic anhydrase